MRPGAVVGRRRWAPPPKARLNRSHPLAQGIASYWLATAPYVDLANGVTLTPEALTSTRQVSAFGDAMSGNARWNYATGAWVPTTECTIVASNRKLGTNSGTSAFGANTGSRCGVHFPYSDGVIYWDFNGSASGTSRLTYTPSAAEMNDSAVWAFTASQSAMEIWRAGVRKATQSCTPGVRINNDYMIHGGASASPGDGNQYLNMVALWYRVLSPAEIEMVSFDPFQMLVL